MRGEVSGIRGAREKPDAMQFRQIEGVIDRDQKSATMGRMSSDGYREANRDRAS